MNRLTLATATLATIAATGSALVSMPPLLVWNASASAPVGLYVVIRGRPPAVGALEIIQPPQAIARFAAQRGYLPLGVPMLKRVAALPRQKICRVGPSITVDEVALGVALERDRMGRSLPGWQGCRIVASDEIFVMNWRVADSLDGRYFGAYPASSIVGTALPLWTDEAGDGRYVWLAPATSEPPQPKQEGDIP